MPYGRRGYGGRRFGGGYGRRTSATRAAFAAGARKAERRMGRSRYY